MVIVAALVGSGLLVQDFNGPPAFGAGDHAADFLKVVLALPGPPSAPDHLGFEPLIHAYEVSRDYRGQLGVLHLPPLSMLASLTARHLFGLISPAIVFMLLIAGFLAALGATMLRFGGRLQLAAAALLSYPALLVVERGNLYAGVAGLCVVIALVRRKPDWFAAGLLGVAVNIRPNEVICALPLLLLDRAFAVRLGIAGVAIVVPAAVLSHLILGAYTVDHFRSGLAVYARMYAAQGGGVPGGSSLYGALYALGFEEAYLTPVLIGGALLLAAMVQFLRARMAYADLVFICCAVTALASTVFANYHLIIFLAPLLLAHSRVNFGASLLLLCPLSLGWVGQFNAQVIVNPALMLAAGLWLLSRSVHHGRGAFDEGFPGGRPAFLS